MRKKYAMIGLTIFISAALWANSLNEKTQDSFTGDTIVMKVGKCSITVSEAMIYLLNCRQQIESEWGTDMWSAETGTNQDGTPITYEEEVKEDILNDLKVEKTLYQEAQKEGLSLSKKEKKKCKKLAEKEISKFHSEDLITYEITVEKVSSYYKEQKLVEKMYNQILKDFEAEYDPEDYKQMTVYGVLFPTFENNEDGEQIEMSQKQKHIQEKNAYEAYQKVSSGEKITNIAKEYKLEYAGEKTFRLSQMDEEYWKEFKNLEDGQLSNMLVNENGYVFVQMVCRDDKEKEKEAIAEEIEKQKKEMFDRCYEENYKELYKVKMEEDVWKQLPLASESDET